jgi:hypothetical protein
MAERKYPEGRLSADDDGELEIRVAVRNGRIIMSFGKPIDWIGLTVKDAEGMIKSLQDNINIARWYTPPTSQK